MAQEFYTIITKIGQEKLVSATTGQKLEFYQFAVGDGNGRYYEPTVSQYALVNEKYRANTNATTIEENRITIECLIPAHIGGFTIREIGIFDKQGSLVLVGKYPQTEKPVDSFGGLKDLYIKVQLEVDNPETIAMTVDPNVVIVTKQNLNQELSNYLKKNETVNDLDSSDKDRPLSAAQGKRLNENKLGITEKAADSDKLDGQDSTYFATSQKAGSLETQIEQLRADIQNLTQQLNNKADKNNVKLQLKYIVADVLIQVKIKDLVLSGIMNCQFSAINCPDLPEQAWSYSVDYFWLESDIFRVRLYRTYSPDIIYSRDLKISTGWIGDNWILYKLTTI